MSTLVNSVMSQAVEGRADRQCGFLSRAVHTDITIEGGLIMGPMMTADWHRHSVTLPCGF